MTNSLSRRRFLLTSGLTAGALCAGSVKTLFASNSAERAAMQFVRTCSDVYRLEKTEAGLSRWVVQVREFARLSEALQCTRRHGIARLHTAGTRATFQISGRDFELEALLPGEFAARNS